MPMAYSLSDMIQRTLNLEEETRAAEEAAAVAARDHRDKVSGLVACYNAMREMLDDRPVIYRDVVVSKDSDGGVQIRKWRRTED